MDKEKQAAWLDKQINSAHDSFSDWPSWMKDAAKFEVSSSYVDQDKNSPHITSSGNRRTVK